MNKLNVLNCNIRPVRESDLQDILEWRNHIDVRRYMFTQHKISLSEHRIWFEKVNQNQSKHCLIFEIEGVPCGFLSINELVCGKIADWGFYLSPDAPKGSGTLLGSKSLEYAFTTLKLHKICGQALYYNERSIRLHKKLGFLEEGFLNDQFFDGEKFHPVVLFGLLVQQWKDMKEVLNV